MRTLLVVGLVLNLARVVLGLPIISEVMQSTLPTECPSVGKAVVVTDYSHLSWQGRALSLTELGCAYTPTSRLALGAAYRDCNGHGRSEQTQYIAHGWEAWGSLHLQAERAQRPDLSLNAQIAHDTINWKTDNAYSALWGTTHGIDLCAGKHIGREYCQVDAGVEDVSLWGGKSPNSTATLLALGAAIHHHFTRVVDGHLALAGYRDNYAGGVRHTYALLAGMRAGRAGQPYLGCSVSYFPRGIPLAGTPLSMAAMTWKAEKTWALDSSSTFMTQSIGYVSVEAGIPF